MFYCLLCVSFLAHRRLLDYRCIDSGVTTASVDWMSSSIRLRADVLLSL